jgi:hypothetical protein
LGAVVTVVTAVTVVVDSGVEVKHGATVAQATDNVGLEGERLACGGGGDPVHFLLWRLIG